MSTMDDAGNALMKQLEDAIRADERAEVFDKIEELLDKAGAHFSDGLGALGEMKELLSPSEPPQPVKRRRKRTKPTDQEVEAVLGFLVAQVQGDISTYWYPSSISMRVKMEEGLVRAACTTLVGAGKVESFQEGYKAIG